MLKTIVAVWQRGRDHIRRGRVALDFSFDDLVDRIEIERERRWSYLVKQLIHVDREYSRRVRFENAQCRVENWFDQFGICER